MQQIKTKNNSNSDVTSQIHNLKLEDGIFGKTV